MIAVFSSSETCAPASRPRLVIVAIVDEPGSEQYYGGQVAAPLFATVMAEALGLPAGKLSFGIANRSSPREE